MENLYVSGYVEKILILRRSEEVIRYLKVTASHMYIHFMKFFIFPVESAPALLITISISLEKVIL